MPVEEALARAARAHSFVLVPLFASVAPPGRGAPMVEPAQRDWLRHGIGPALLGRVQQALRPLVAPLVWSGEYVGAADQERVLGCLDGELVQELTGVLIHMEPFRISGTATITTRRPRVRRGQGVAPAAAVLAAPESPAALAAPEPPATDAMATPSDRCPIVGCSWRLSTNTQRTQAHLRTHRPEELAAAVLPSGYHLCAAEGCGVVYFSTRRVLMCMSHRHMAGARATRTTEGRVGPEQLVPTLEPLQPTLQAPGLILAEVRNLPGAVMSFVPSRARSQVAAALASVLAHGPSSLGAWLRYAVFARLVLVDVVPGSGGRAAQVRRRAVLFQGGDLDSLLEDVADQPYEVQTNGQRDQEDQRWPLFDGETKGSASRRDALDTAATSVSARTAARASAHVRAGAIGKAMQALAAVEVAKGADALEELRKLHPPATEATPTFVGDQQFSLSGPEVIKLLRSFPPGSSGGPSCLRPGMLLDLCLVPGSLVADAIAPFVASVCRGDVPEAIADAIFGANLTPLRKAAGGIRPVSAGDTLRRVGGKYLLRQLPKKDLSRIFDAFGQVGVGKAGGCEVMVAGAKSFAKSLGRDPSLILLEVDKRNAFNLFSRPKFLAFVHQHAPFADGHLAQAYGRPRPLWVRGSPDPIMSACGGQQGDIWVPFGFAGVLGEVTSSAPAVKFRAFDLDDGLLGGTASQLEAWLGHMCTVGLAAGLHINWGKCYIVRDDANADWDPDTYPLLAQCTRKRLAEIITLGSPLDDGDDEARAYWEKHIEKVERVHSRIRSFATHDPHAAFWMMRQCAGSSLSIYAARCSEMPAWAIAQLDTSLLQTWSALGVPVTDLERLSLPIRLSGLGLRPLARVALIAHTCALGTARHETHIFFPQEERAAPTAAPIAAPIAVSIAAPPINCSLLVNRITSSFGESVANLVAAGIAEPAKGKGLQKRAVAMVEEAIFASKLAAASLVEQVRIRSSSHPRANYYLAPPPRCMEMCLLRAPEFDMALRLRFGVPTGNLGASCNRCHDDVDKLDNMGTHELACMCGPQRIGLHNAGTDNILSYATRGGLNPGREARPFADDAQARLDVSFLHANSIALLDFAVTSHLRRQNLQAAAEKSGGAATAYEAVKRSRYAAHIAPGQILYPVVTDTLGAWGDSAAKPLEIVAKAYARRSGYGPSAVHFLYAQLNSTITRGVAQLMLMNSAVGNDFSA